MRVADVAFDGVARGRRDTEERPARRLLTASGRSGSVAAMRSCPPGWATDLAILEHTGSVGRGARSDHLVVRTPANPDFHWGNFLLVTDEDAVDDADRWVGDLRGGLPARRAGSRSGCRGCRVPAAPGPRTGSSLELEDVLSTRTLPRRTPLPRATRCAGSPATTGTGPRPRRGGERPHRRGGPGVVPPLRAGAAAGPAGPLGARPRRLVRRLRGRRARRRPRHRALRAAARYQDVTTDEAHRGAGWPRTCSASPRSGPPSRLRPVGDRHRGHQPGRPRLPRLGFAPDTGTVQAYRRPPALTRPRRALSGRGGRPRAGRP